MRGWQHHRFPRYCLPPLALQRKRLTTYLVREQQKWHLQCRHAVTEHISSGKTASWDCESREQRALSSTTDCVAINFLPPSGKMTRIRRARLLRTSS